MLRTEKELLEQISKVVEGEIPSFEMDYPISIDTITEYLKEKHQLEDTDEFESNGWQWDYWMYYQGEQGRFVLGGVGWYATQSFSKE